MAKPHKTCLILCSRETEHTAILIDNSFTNSYVVNDQLYPGIFLNDISDHNG